MVIRDAIVTIIELFCIFFKDNMTKNESSPTSNFQFLSYDLKSLEHRFNHGLTLQKCFE